MLVGACAGLLVASVVLLRFWLKRALPKKRKARPATVWQRHALYLPVAPCGGSSPWFPCQGMRPKVYPLLSCRTC